MSVLKTLKLGKAAPTTTPTDAKGRARAKVVAHLEQQKALLGRSWRARRSRRRGRSTGPTRRASACG